MPVRLILLMPYRLSHESRNRTLPGSKYMSRQRVILKLSAEIPVGFDCATDMPQTCDRSPPVRAGGPLIA